METSSDTNLVKRYYDKNTPRFLTLGHGSSAKAIHRAVWAPGITNREDAIHYVHARISEYLQKSGVERVLDIGCGVGGTILYLAERHPASFLGITLSSVQASLGASYIETSGFSDRCSVIPGDFCLSPAVGNPGEEFDLAYAIEAFLHMNDPECFFEKAASLLRQGGRLIVADDFLTRRGAETPEKSKDGRMIESFRRDWHARSLISFEKFLETADKFRFIPAEDEDLTPYLELDRPRDLLLRPLAGLLRRLPHSSPMVSNIVGGDALQYCLKNSLVEHRFVVLRR
jgi:cyclopropane fatty-acyl-phospholipid synthase-like methyltransferase